MGILKKITRRLLSFFPMKIFYWPVIIVIGGWTWLQFSMRERSLRRKILSFAPISLDQKLRKRVIFVSAWFGTDIGGGAEAALLALARDLVRLRPDIDVGVVTTTLKEFAADWNSPAHPEGKSQVEGITVNRFHATKRQRSIFHFLNGHYLMGGAATDYLTSNGVTSPISRFAEYYYLRSMIDSPGLLKFLAKEFSSVDAFIFMPYLMTPVISGARIVREKAIVFPCLHNERYAALGVVREMMSVVRKNLFWVRSERELCGKLYPKANLGSVIGSQVKIDGVHGDPIKGRLKAVVGDAPFILFAGRQIEGKGLPDLVTKFRSFKTTHKNFADLKLVLIGKGDLDYSSDSSITNLGFVTEQEKADIMSGATALIQPSLYESFSIVMMEAWLQQTPVLVDGRCEVTKNHIEDSGGGGIYYTQIDFDNLLLDLLRDQSRRALLGRAGSTYVRQNYSSDVVIGKFIKEI